MFRRFASNFATRMTNNVPTKWRDAKATQNALEIARYRNRIKKPEKDKKVSYQRFQKKIKENAVTIMRDKLVRLGWSEASFLNNAPPPAVDYDSQTGMLTSRSEKSLAVYYQKQTQLWMQKRRLEREERGKKRATRRRVFRERKRLENRKVEVEHLMSDYDRGTERLQLVNSLNSFRNYVRNKLPDSAAPMNEGWPPREAKFIGLVPPFGRELYMFNQRTADGRRRVPMLVVCVKNSPVLFLNEKEVATLQKVTPQFRKLAKQLKTRIKD